MPRVPMEPAMAAPAVVTAVAEADAEVDSPAEVVEAAAVVSPLAPLETALDTAEVTELGAADDSAAVVL